MTATSPHPRLKDAHQFYTLAMREAHAEQHIAIMAEIGKLEITQSRFVGPTYGLSPDYIKQIKARYRNELSFSESGK